jgi:SAM-dependent methyltransferase
MKERNDITEILCSHYTQQFEKYGANADGVDWGSSEKHRYRLHNMVLHVGVDAMAHQSVLDVGCGYGELLTVLDGDFGVRPRSYVGIDPCLPMVEAARQKHPRYRFDAVPFEEFVPAQPVECLFCCGVFTKKAGGSQSDMYDLLNSFFAYAKSLEVRSVIFNTMSPLCDVRPEELFFPDADRIFALMRRHWSYSAQKYAFSNDYLQYEMVAHIELC